MGDQGTLADAAGRLRAGAAKSAGRPAVWSPNVVLGVVRAGDIAILVVAALFAYFVRFGNFELGRDELIAAVLIGPVGANVFHLTGVYRPDALTDAATQARRVMLAWTATMLIVVLLGYLTKTSEQYSRLWAGLWFLFGGASLLMSRYLLGAAINSAGARGALLERVAILSDPAHLLNARHLADHLGGDALHGAELAGFFVTNQADAPGESLSGEARIDGDIGALIQAAEAHRVDRVIAVMPWSDMGRLQCTLEPLRAVSVDVDLAPAAVDDRLLARPVRQSLGVPTINLMTRPLSDWDVVLKRSEDYLVASAALLVAAPLMIVIALAIKAESRGPVLFRQPRHGFNNNLFQVYKFRTMYHESRDIAAERLTVPGDGRITRIGALLRRTSLDELPQLFNVLKGEMSIVGPRPHAVSAKAAGVPYRDAVADYAYRHRVRPGMTGWAQVNGWRGDTDVIEKIEQRVAHDLYYIDNWSLWFDLRIMAMTAFRLSHRNAY